MNKDNTIVSVPIEEALALPHADAPGGNSTSPDTALPNAVVISQYSERRANSNFMKLCVAVPAAIWSVGMLANSALASGLSESSGNEFWPIDLGDSSFARFLSNAVNHPIDSIGQLAATGAVIGGIRMALQLPVIMAQLGEQRQKGIEVNPAAVLRQIGGLLYSTILSESAQYARMPILIAAVYWMNSLSEVVPQQFQGELKMAALVAAGVTFWSAIEALNPLQ